jgi:hypothetical protein
MSNLWTGQSKYNEVAVTLLTKDQGLMTNREFVAWRMNDRRQVIIEVHVQN